MKCIFLVIVSLFLLPSLLFPVSLRNEYIGMEVDDENARLSLAVPGGGDGGRNDLLFRDRPSSSFAAISVGGDVSIIGSTEGRFTSRPVRNGDAIICVWETGPVRVTQTAEFIGRRESGVRDGVLIRYNVKNLAGLEISPGLSIIVDTWLGEKTGTHFLLSDGRSLSRSFEISGGEVQGEISNEMPISWTTTGVGAPCLRGVLKGSSVTPPDRVLFANYRLLRENPFPPKIGTEEFTYGPFSRNDSAVALLFKPVPLAPGGEREYRTILGLCGEGEYGEGMPTPGSSAYGGEPLREMPAEMPEAALPAAVAPEAGTASEGQHPTEVIPQAEKENLESVKETLERIDELLKELNQHLEGERSPATEDQILRLKKKLREIEQGTGGD